MEDLEERDLSAFRLSLFAPHLEVSCGFLYLAWYGYLFKSYIIDYVAFCIGRDTVTSSSLISSAL